MAFHETRFPTGIAFGSRGGPERKTIVVAAGSGAEHRNSQWANSKRRYNAGYGIKSENDIYEVIEFFEERRGKLHGFRWKDRFDWKSCPPSNTITPLDQDCVNITTGLLVGNGSATTFQLRKKYGSSFDPWYRDIKKPVDSTVRVAVNGVEKTIITDFTVDYTTGIVTFAVAPPNGHTVKAGYQFDVPVRFDTDYLEINLSAFAAGAVPDVPVVELKL